MTKGQTHFFSKGKLVHLFCPHFPRLLLSFLPSPPALKEVGTFPDEALSLPTPILSSKNSYELHVDTTAYLEIKMVMSVGTLLCSNHQPIVLL